METAIFADTNIQTMFNHEGVTIKNFKVIAREDAYTRDEVDILLRAAADHDMEVVPLVQTFGHLGRQAVFIRFLVSLGGKGSGLC
jgi:hypothetical protein